MKVILRGVHLSLTRGIRYHVEHRLVEPLRMLLDSEAAELDIHLVDTNGPKGGEDKECRVTAFIPGLAAQHVTERSDDLYKSIDTARDRLERRIKRELQRRRQPDHSESLRHLAP